MVEVGDEDFFRLIDPDSDSIAIIVKHVAGNLRSRWTDFLTTDGEKPWRGRDSEFEIPAGDNRQAIMDAWEAGWSMVLRVLETLSENDLARAIAIRGERHSVMQAMNRALAHCAHHAGQIVFLAKNLRAGNWQQIFPTIGRLTAPFAQARPRKAAEGPRAKPSQ